MVKINMRLVFVGMIIIIFFSMQNAIPKQAVANVEGNLCAEDTVSLDCPCWGETPGGEEAFGIGQGRCIDSACDMTFCFDVEPVKDWVSNNPLAWLTNPENSLIVVLLAGLMLLVVMWPKL